MHQFLKESAQFCCICNMWQFICQIDIYKVVIINIFFILVVLNIMTDKEKRCIIVLAKQKIKKGDILNQLVYLYLCLAIMIFDLD